MVRLIIEVPEASDTSKLVDAVDTAIGLYVHDDFSVWEYNEWLAQQPATSCDCITEHPVQSP